VISQPVSSRQKPRAKLRDSFIQRSQDSESGKRSSDDLTDTRVVSQRTNSLQAIIQKHEKIVHGKKVVKSVFYSTFLCNFYSYSVASFFFYFQKL
jgi:hypothetical protein